MIVEIKKYPLQTKEVPVVKYGDIRRKKLFMKKRILILLGILIIGGGGAAGVCWKMGLIGTQTVSGDAIYVSEVSTITGSLSGVTNLSSSASLRYYSSFASITTRKDSRTSFTA